MRVRLKLKEPYEWPSKDPENPNKNQIGFVITDWKGQIGDTVSFEALNPQSMAGDLNTDHYRFFAGKTFKSVNPPYHNITVELLEI